MGFISIFGIAIQDAILVVTYFQRLRAEGHGARGGRAEAAEKRLRPVLMTTLVAMLGLLPGGALARHRLADAEAAGHRGHRRLADPRDPPAPAAAAAAGAGPRARAALDAAVGGAANPRRQARRIDGPGFT